VGADPRFSVVAANLPRGGDRARMSMWSGPVLAPEVRAEMTAATVRPLRIFARMLWRESRAAVIVVLALLVISVATGVLDAILMRGLAAGVSTLTLPSQRVSAVMAVAVFLAVAFA